MAHRVPVSVDDSQDPLSRMRAFQLAGELVADCFDDAKLLVAEPITREIAGQLYNGCLLHTSEHRRGLFPKFREGSGNAIRVCIGFRPGNMSWYKSASPVLGDATVKNRRNRLEEMRRLLLAIIPRERGRKMK